MHHWRKLCTLLSVILLAAVLFLSCYGSPLTRYQLSRQVQAHLLQEGYDSADIASLEVVYDRQEQIRYVVAVVFRQETEPVYYYCDNDLQIQPLPGYEEDR